MVERPGRWHVREQIAVAIIGFPPVAAATPALVPIRMFLFSCFSRPLAPYSCRQLHNRARFLGTSRTCQPLAFGGFLQTFLQRFCFAIHLCLAVGHAKVGRGAGDQRNRAQPHPLASRRRGNADKKGPPRSLRPRRAFFVHYAKLKTPSIGPFHGLGTTERSNVRHRKH